MISKRSIILGLSCILLIGSISTLQIRNLHEVSSHKWEKGDNGYSGNGYTEGSDKWGNDKKEDDCDEQDYGGNGKWNNKKYINNKKSDDWHNEKKDECESKHDGKSGKWNNKWKNDKKDDCDHKDHSGYYPDAGIVPPTSSPQVSIVGPWPNYGKKEETVFVAIDASTFYEYTVTNKDCKIQIAITDQNSKCYNFEFKRFNEVVLIDAYNHIILVQEVSSTGAILSLYVIQINYDAIKCEFSIDSFAVNSVQDDEFYFFADPWWVGEVLTFNIVENWISIPKFVKGGATIYKINIAQRLNTLLTVGWFNYDKKKPEQIDGGNSKVLYDRNNDQFLIDQNTCRFGYVDPTIYKRVPICELVNLPLYQGQGTTYDYVSWFFQYASTSKNNKEITTFLYQGYGDRNIINPVNLKSKTALIIRSDDYSFFTVITDCDIYLTTIDYNNKTSKYDVYSNLLSETCFNAKKRAEVVRDWSAAVEIFFVEGTFYLFTKTTFIVYSDCPSQWNKVYEEDCQNIDTNDTKGLFKYIRNYLKRK